MLKRMNISHRAQHFRSSFRRSAAACGHRPRRGRQPEVDLADEPTGNLTQNGGSWTYSRTQPEGTTIVMVTPPSGTPPSPKNYQPLDGQIVGDVRTNYDQLLPVKLND